MANELELRQNGIGGLVEDNPLTNVATVLTSAALAAMDAVTSTSFMWVIIDPDGLDGAPEHVKFTAHTAGATTATILRGQGGTTARQHAAGTPWIHGPVAADFTAWEQKEWLNAAEMSSMNGGPTLGFLGANNYEGTAAWMLTASSNDIVGGNLVIPDDWASWDLDVYWSGSAAGTGNVTFRVDRLALVAGATVATRTFGNGLTVATPGQNLLAITESLSAVTTRGVHRIQVDRDGPNAGDTYAGSMGVIGCLARRLT